MKLRLFRSTSQAYNYYMNPNTKPYDQTSIELLAQIIDRARTDNGTLSDVSRTELCSELELIGQIFSAPGEATEQQENTQWDMIQEEHPLPTRIYKSFAGALASDDPIATLKSLSYDKIPSALFHLQIRINSRARSTLPSIEKELPKLKTAEWGELS